MQDFFKKYRIPLLHLGFWIIYFSFFFYQITFGWGQDKTPGFIFVEALIHVLFVGIIVYINYSYLLPAFLKDRNVSRYALRLAFYFVLVVGCFLALKRWETQGTEDEAVIRSTPFLIHFSVTTLFIVAFISMLRFVEDWFSIEARKKDMENEKLNTELRFLKEQINPHFLFNTLNSLYFLTGVQTEKAQEVIVKLSKMMRYMLYDSNRPTVCLEQEVEYMQNYIAMEKMRVEKNIPIHFTIEGECAGVEIVPLILNTFLENAFKHGLNNPNADGFINVTMQVHSPTLTFRVENTISPHPDPKEKSGIGLQNVRRRLALSYPEKHVLTLTECPERYLVELKLDVK